MKAVVALALAGSALAGYYDAPPKSSAPADPVVPSKGYGGDYDPPKSSAPADPVVPSKGYGGDYPKSSSTPAAPVVPSKGYGGDYDYPKSSSTPADPVLPSKSYGGDYGYSKSSSTPASPVVPSKSYGGDYGYAKSSSASSSAKPSGKPVWDEDDEECDDDEEDDEDDSSYTKKPSVSAAPTYSKKYDGDYEGGYGGKPSKGSYTKSWEEVVDDSYVKTTTYTDSNGHAYPTEVTVTVKSTRTNVVTLSRSKTSSFLAWATPAYFDTLACCKTIVTVTEYVPGYVKPTYSPSAAPSYTPKGDYDYDHDYVPKPSSSTPAAPELPSKPAYTPKPDYTPAPEAEYTPKPSVPAAPAVPSTPAYSGEGPFKHNGDKWGITYTPYTQQGQCKTADEVDADLAKIKTYGFTTIRLYATDCSGLTNVATLSKKHGLDIILGVFIDKTGVQASWTQVDEIGAWGQANGWDNVVLVVVGNEAIFNGYVSGPDLATYITQVKSFLTGKGYSGWVTTTEPVNIVQANKDCLAPVVDVAGANIQPFFTSSVTAYGAGDFVLGQLALVEAALGKTAYNLECGWPSQGKSNGAAVPSKDEQKTAILDIIAKAGKKTVVFSFEDDLWKGDDEFGVEKYWGCGDIFGY